MADKPDHKILRRKLRKDATFPERLLWSILKGKLTGFKFRRQDSIGPFIVDFTCPELSLVIEIDGVHHAYPGMQNYDTEREKVIIDAGFKVLRYSDQEVTDNLEGVVLDIIYRCQAEQKKTPL